MSVRDRESKYDVNGWARLLQTKSRLELLGMPTIWWTASRRERSAPLWCSLCSLCVYVDGNRTASLVAWTAFADGESHSLVLCVRMCALPICHCRGVRWVRCGAARFVSVVWGAMAGCDRMAITSYGGESASFYSYSALYDCLAARAAHRIVWRDVGKHWMKLYSIRTDWLRAH